MKNLQKQEFQDNGALMIKDIFGTTMVTHRELDEQIEVILETGELAKSMSYSEMMNANTCLVNKRNGTSDQGMIDIFHPEKKSPYFHNLINQIKNELSIPKFLDDCTGKNFQYSHSNIYINRSILKTRGMHVDNFASNSVKLLVYLSDVTSEDYGPYAYVLGSHKRTALRRSLSERLSNYYPKIREMYPSGEHKIFLGTTGSGILSDQSGFHRGIPQKMGKNRKVLVLNYWLKQK